MAIEVKAGRLIVVEIDLNDVGDGVGTPNWVRIAQQNTSGLSRSTDLFDATNKDDNGWPRAAASRTPWSFSCEVKLDPTDPAYIYLETKWRAKQRVWARFNATDAAIGGSIRFGQVWIATFDEDAPEGDAYVATLELQGDGELKNAA